MKLVSAPGRVDEELDDLQLPSTSLSTLPITGSRLDSRTDFKVSYVNGCDDVTMTSDQNSQEKSNALATIFGAFFLFMRAIFGKLFHGLNPCRPVKPSPYRNEEASLSAVEVERIEEELRKTPRKPQKANAPVY